MLDADERFPAARGPRVWFLAASQLIEIRMMDGLFEDIIQAAAVLDARYFIVRRKIYLGLPEVWAVFDTTNLKGSVDGIPVALPGGLKARPIRTFDTATIDGPAMWARMQEVRS